MGTGGIELLSQSVFREGGALVGIKRPDPGIARYFPLSQPGLVSGSSLQASVSLSRKWACCSQLCSSQRLDRPEGMQRGLEHAFLLSVCPSVSFEQRANAVKGMGWCPARVSLNKRQLSSSHCHSCESSATWPKSLQLSEPWELSRM